VLWFIGLLMIIAVLIGLGAAFGAPYLPILSRDREPLLDLAGVSTGSSIIDLGSGDGRLLLAAARRGAIVVGYEINPFLWLISLILTWRYRHQTTIHLANFWNVTLPEVDVIYVFLLRRYMDRLNSKLEREIVRPTKLVSFVFEIPNRKPIEQSQNVFVYTYGKD
jgi:hypothetical protein